MFAPGRIFPHRALNYRMDPTTHRDLLLTTRDSALRTAYAAQCALDALNEGVVPDDSDTRRLAAEAYRYRLDVKAAWALMPWRQRVRAWWQRLTGSGGAWR